MRAGPGAAREARHAFLGLDIVLPRPAKHTAVLLLNELVANAVKHAGAGPKETIEVTVDESDDRLHVGVRDPAPPFSPNVDPEHVRLRARGLGLYFMNELSDDWGIEPHERGKTVWFALPIR